MNAAIIVPLTIHAAVSGSVTGTGTMDTTQMDDMIGGQTYVNIHCSITRPARSGPRSSTPDRQRPEPPINNTML